MGQQQKRQKDELMDVARDFDVVMLCTVSPDGSVHARPMVVADIDGGDAWWFITSRRTGKVDEIAHDGHATVTAQGRKVFASLSGRARIVSDQKRLGDIWQKEFSAWFPEGPSDPDAVLLRFEPDRGEYWERGFKQAAKLSLETARAWFSKKPHPEKVEQGNGHGKVSLH